MSLWYADVSNAFAEADQPKQMYYMRCDSVFREWWAYVLFLRQVDDFSVACRYESIYIALCDALEKHRTVPMTCYGMMIHFNGIDVSQFRTHISISTKTYLDTVFNNNGWDLTPTSLPMNPSN
jgi:hypothetical protein